MSSFDSPISALEEDFFERGKVAKRILGLIDNSDSSWSTRIGLYGAWGEGKSSVLELLKKLAPKEEFVIISFTPSGIQTREELFREFMLQIGVGLKAAGVTKRDWKKGLKVLSGFLNKSKDFIANLGESVGFESSTAKAGIGASSLLLNKLITPGAKNFEKIQKKIEGKRFIVIVDDLDRVNPELIPEILLSLRDVLDLPGFNFVLAFDYKVITKAISSRNEAWGDGRRFMEKIIDYPISLSLPTRQQCGEFLRYWLQELEVPSRGFGNLDWLLENLPKNPRKLKLFIRQLSAATESLKRLGPKDVDVKLVCLFLLIKIDYPEFMQRFLSDPEAFNIIQWLGLSSHRQDESESARTKRKEINKLAIRYGKQSGLDKSASIRALSAIERAANLTPTSSASGFRVAAKFFDEPPKMTRVELEQVLAVAEDEGLPNGLNQHAEKLGFFEEDVKLEFLRLITQKYGELLDAASNVHGSTSHEELLTHASEIIELLTDQFSSGYLLASDDVFLGFYDVMRSWSHFNSNAADQALREKEKEFLLSLLDTSAHELVSKDNRLIHSLPISSEMNQETKELNGLIVEKLDSALVDDLIARMKRRHGIEELFNQNMSRHKSLLFDISGPLWKHNKSEMLGAINGGSPLSIENSYQWLRLLRFGRAQHLGIANEVEILTGFAKSDEIVGALWRAASSEPLQFRVASEFEEIRQLLMRNNPEIEFKSPDWLTAHIDRLDERLGRDGHVSYDAQPNPD